MEETRKLAHNTIIQILGKGLTITFALVGFGLTTRHLGQEGFGFLVTIYAFLTIFGILVDLGLQMTTTQLISNPKEDESKILSNALTIRLIASIIFLSIAPIVVLFFPYPSIVKIGVAVAAVGFLFNSLTATITSLFQKHLTMIKSVIADEAAKIIYLTLIFAAVFLNWGLFGIIAALVVDSIVTFAILFYFAQKQTVLKPSFDFIIWKKIFTKTWPIALTIALNLIYFKGDLFIMSLIRTPSEVGLYGAPYRVLEVLINISFLLLGLILPILAASAAAKNFTKFKEMLQSTFDFLVIFTVPMIIGTLFLGESIMVFVSGSEFIISGQLIKILMLATGAIFIASLFGYAVVALDQQKRMIKFYAINAVISIIGYIYLISNYGYWGAAWMTVFTEVFILVTAGYVMYKNIKFLPKLTLLGKSIIASLLMAIPLVTFSNLNFLILAFTAIIVYFVTLYALKGFDKQFVLDIIKIKK